MNLRQVVCFRHGEVNLESSWVAKIVTVSRTLLDDLGCMRMQLSEFLDIASGLHDCLLQLGLGFTKNLLSCECKFKIESIISAS